MHAVGRLHAAAGSVQDTLADHVAGAVEAFLARLEHQHDVAGQLVAAFGEQGRGAGEHGRVQVVAAGVHGALDRGRVVDAGLLLDGQAVHVRAEQDRGPLGSPGASGARRCAAAQDRGDRRRVLAQGDLVGQPVQRLEDLLLRARQLQADLRLAVQVVAEAGKVSPAFPWRLRRSACALLVCGSGFVVYSEVACFTMG